MELEIKLKQLLKERNMEQKELAALTGLSNRTISELATNKTERIPKTAICKIAEVLEINDIREILDFKTLSE
ncbi:helix-turn-helix domain-containing protein [Lysinibacillus antri]|nr:helix-turn-helix transcriptional regulator [Lysinibacillus antri]